MTLPTWFNGAFIMSLISLVGIGSGFLLAVCLKSRCRTIKCCCIECERDVIHLSANDITIPNV